jgi:hypothetical protein
VDASVMAIVTLGLATSFRTAYEPLGLSSAPGFAVYSIPFAIAALAAWFDIREADDG